MNTYIVYFTPTVVAKVYAISYTEDKRKKRFVFHKARGRMTDETWFSSDSVIAVHKIGSAAEDKALKAEVVSEILKGLPPTTGLLTPKEKRAL